MTSKSPDENVSLLRGLLQNIPGMVYRGKPDWSIDIMRGCEQLCGYTPEEVCGMDGRWLAVVHPEDRATVQADGAEVVARPMSIVQEYRITTKSGDVKWVEDRKTSFFADGKFAGVDGVLFDITSRRQTQAALRQAQERLIEQQRQALLELSTPVIQVWDDILVVPLIGAIDSARAQQIMENVLEAVAKRAEVLIIDVTGVPVVDSKVADHIIKTIEATRLLGAVAIVTGISPLNAQTLVRLGVDVSRLNTRGSLAAGLRLAFELTHRVVMDS